jgi:hypothetical protein
VYPPTYHHITLADKIASREFVPATLPRSPVGATRPPTVNPMSACRGRSQGGRIGSARPNYACTLLFGLTLGGAQRLRSIRSSAPRRDSAERFVLYGVSNCQTDLVTSTTLARTRILNLVPTKAIFLRTVENKLAAMCHVNAKPRVEQWFVLLWPRLTLFASIFLAETL